MNPIDSIYNKIVSDIEKDLPIPIKRPSRTRYSRALQKSENSDVKSASFEKTLEGVERVRTIDTKDISSRIESAIIGAAARYKIDYSLIKGVIKAESSFNPNSVSHAGAMGLMQLMPSNVEEYGVTDPFNIEQNINAGTKHLRDMLDRFNNDVSLALAAYNAGPGNVNKYGGIPPFKETQDYVPRVLAYAETFKNGS